MLVDDVRQLQLAAVLCLEVSWLGETTRCVGLMHMPRQCHAAAVYKQQRYLQGDPLPGLLQSRGFCHCPHREWIWAQQWWCRWMAAVVLTQPQPRLSLPCRLLHIQAHQTRHRYRVRNSCSTCCSCCLYMVSSTPLRRLCTELHLDASAASLQPVYIAMFL